jgi:dUTP pyrophosphatase
MLEAKIKKLHKDAVIPKYETVGSVGMDLTAVSKEYDEHGNIVYGTGLAIQIPEGYYADLRPRSSISKYDLVLANSVGTIDSDYRGELILKFKPSVYFGVNRGDDDGVMYDVGDRIAQLVILPYPKVSFVEVDELSDTERGTGGFGSTNK